MFFLRKQEPRDWIKSLRFVAQIAFVKSLCFSISLNPTRAKSNDIIPLVSTKFILGLFTISFKPFSEP